MDGGLFDDDDLSLATSDVDADASHVDDSFDPVTTATSTGAESPRHELNDPPTTQRRRRLPKSMMIAAAATAAAIIIAASILLSIGGGGSTAHPSSGLPSSSSRTAFAKCLAKYGVTLPSGSPGSGVGPGNGPGLGGAGGSPPSNMSSAFRHCASLLPSGGFAGPPGGSFNGGGGTSGGGPIAQ